jgi:hypothetical protein
MKINSKFRIKKKKEEIFEKIFKMTELFTQIRLDMHSDPLFHGGDKLTKENVIVNAKNSTATDHLLTMIFCNIDLTTDNVNKFVDGCVREKKQKYEKEYIDYVKLHEKLAFLAKRK